MSIPSKSVDKFVSDGSVPFGGRGTTADGNRPAILRSATIHIANVTVIPSFSHPFVHDA